MEYPTQKLAKSVRELYWWSKLDSKVGTGVYSTCLPINKAIRLPDHCSVFQTEICALYASINWFETNRQSVPDVCMLSDSQAALRPLDSDHIMSRSVLTYRISLKQIATQMKIYLRPEFLLSIDIDDFARSNKYYTGFSEHMKTGSVLYVQHFINEMFIILHALWLFKR